MRQSQANQLTFNEFQRSSPNGNLRRYLPGFFKNINKLINLWVVNLFRSIFVFKFFNSLNIVFILAILTLSGFGLRTWIYPKYPNEVDGMNPTGTTREIKPLVIARKNQPSQKVNEIVSNNLFRKERNEYRAPPPQQQPNTELDKTLAKPSLPSPELSLSGVMILNDTKIAILEGSYSVMQGDKTKTKTIKRKGYYLGERIGDYKIELIEKRAITLSNPSGQTLVVKLIRRVPNVKKSKKKKHPKIISTRPNEKNKVLPTKHISGSLTKPAPRHISGR